MIAGYVGAGVTAPLLMTAVSLENALSSKSCMLILPSYLGMVLVWVVSGKYDILSCDPLPCSSSTSSFKREYWLASACIVDLACGLSQYGAIICSGNLVFMVASSMSLIYVALLRSIYFGVRLDQRQRIGLVFIVVGLCFTTKFTPSMYSTGQSATVHQDGGNNVVGGVLTSVAAFLHATSTVLLETLLVYQRIPGPVILVWLGGVGAIAYVLWGIVFFTVVTTENELDSVIDEKRIGVVVAVFIFLILNSMVHAFTLLSSVSRLGGTSTGIIRAMQSVILFCLDHVFFCGTDEKQCLNPKKVISSIFTITGVLLYSSAGEAREEDKHPYEEIRSVEEVDKEEKSETGG